MMFWPVHPLFLVGMLIPLALILLVVWAVWASTTHRASSAGGPPLAPPAAGSEAPIDVLKRRLAAGEITPDEFDRMRKLLES
jgi:uncharacterized membrane protein